MRLAEAMSGITRGTHTSEYVEDTVSVGVERGIGTDRNYFGGNGLAAMCVISLCMSVLLVLITSRLQMRLVNTLDPTTGTRKA